LSENQCNFRDRKSSGPIRWSMLISHHPPCDYGRTFKLFGIRICTRCFGVIAGILFYIVSSFLTQGVTGIEYLLAMMILPLPAVFDFSLHELNILKSNNPKRFVTGLMLGIPVAYSLAAFAGGHILCGIIVILWILLLEFGVALILNRNGHLEKLIKRYEAAVRK